MGRYVCTFVSAWKMQLENGYVIRNFKGDIVNSAELKDQFYDFQWRPRPPSLLSKEQEAEREARIQLRDGALSDDESDYVEIETFVERVVDEQEEEIEVE